VIEDVFTTDSGLRRPIDYQPQLVTPQPTQAYNASPCSTVATAAATHVLDRILVVGCIGHPGHIGPTSNVRKLASPKHKT
jgi:hypothetical protein